MDIRPGGVVMGTPIVWFDGDDDYGTIHHNPTDFFRYQQFQKRQRDIYAHITAQDARRHVAHDLDKWSRVVPPEGRDARVLLGGSRIIDGASIDAHVMTMMSAHPYTSWCFYGDGERDKNRVAYGLVKTMVARGVPLNSILFTTDTDVVHGATASFQTKQSFFNRLRRRAWSTIMVAHVGESKTHYTDHECAWWSSLVTMSLDRDIRFVWTSRLSPKHFTAFLTDEAMSALAPAMRYGLVVVDDNDDTGETFSLENAPLSRQDRLDNTVRRNRDHQVSKFTSL